MRVGDDDDDGLPEIQWCVLSTDNFKAPVVLTIAEVAFEF